MPSNRFIAYAQVSILLLSLSGCFGSTPPSHFYLLESIGAAENQAMVAVKRPVIVLAPIRVPEYVDRPQIVTAMGRNSYSLSEFERWAEPLNDNISRVLQQDLAALVPAEVVTGASARAKQAQFRVAVNILEFHVDAQQQAHMTVQWYLTSGETTSATRQNTYRQTATQPDYPAKVDALNACLHDLSRDIATALQQAAARQKAD